jgi:hypothetical protein
LNNISQADTSLNAEFNSETPSPAPSTFTQNETLSPGQSTFTQNENSIPSTSAASCEINRANDIHNPRRRPPSKASHFEKLVNLLTESEKKGIKKLKS